MGSALGRNSNPIRNEDQPQSRSPNVARVAPKSGASSCGLMAEFPTAGSYRLFLQFKTDGRVHTAAFTQEVSR